jgi:hypothetical protein
MNGRFTLLLSLIATAASLPFFLFTLPAGALADLSNRRNLLIAVYLWLAAADRAAGGLYLAALGSPAPHLHHGFFAGDWLRV